MKCQLYDWEQKEKANGDTGFEMNLFLLGRDTESEVNMVIMFGATGGNIQYVYKYWVEKRLSIQKTESGTGTFCLVLVSVPDKRL